MALATVEEFASYLETTFTTEQETRAALLLDLAGGLVEGWCNKVSFAVITDDEVDLTGTWSSVIELPGQPVDSVAAVEIDGVAVTDYTLVRGSLHRGETDGWNPYNKSRMGHWGGPDALVHIVYTHGFTEVPWDAKAVTLEVAARAHVNPSGVRSESIDGYSVTFAGGGRSSSVVVLTDDDKRSLGRYRRRSG